MVARSLEEIESENPMEYGKTVPVKTVIITLAPGDPGPVCSYSPFCSPSDLDLAAWREATIELTETELRVPQNEERELIERWILQLVRRELTIALEKAEKELKQPLAIHVDDTAAEVISTALKIKGSG